MHRGQLADSASLLRSEALENPYQSSTTGNNRKLHRTERIHRNVLGIYMKYRGADMPFSYLLWMYLKRWIVTIAVMFGMLLILSGIGAEPDRTLIGILVGMVLGMILRDVGTCRMTSRLWPFTRELLDWNVVEMRFEELA